MSEFEIIQYNVCKSWDVMASFLREERVRGADVVTIQEPWRNRGQDTTHQPATAAFQLLYPGGIANGEDEQPGVCLFVSKKIDPAKWSCQLISRDYQLLKVRRQQLYDGSWTDVFIHNIYNRPRSGTLELLGEQLRCRPLAEHIIVGDMNAHHPRWGGPGAKQDAEGEDLLYIMDEHDLVLTTEEGEFTWQRVVEGRTRQSVLDLTYMSNSIQDRLISCGKADDVESTSDHWPIRTKIDIETPQFQAPRRRNWQAMDTKALTQFTEQHLTCRDLTNADSLRTGIEFNAFTRVIDAAIDHTVPWANPSEWSNPGFDDDCRQEVKETRRLRRRFNKTRSMIDWNAYTHQRNHKSRLVKKRLSLAHRRRVQSVIEEGPRGLWRLAKWARNRHGSYEKGITPALKRPNGSLAESVDDKADTFRGAFFPQPPPPDLTDIEGYAYPGPVDMPPIAKHEITNAIMAATATKAPGDDTIPNGFWHQAIRIPVVLDTIHQLFNSCVRNGFNPPQLQRSVTVVLRKGGGRDYQVPKSWRPVALLNTLGKHLESVIARRISHAVEIYDLLPKSHLGGRRGVSTDHAIQIMLDQVYKAWGDRIPVVSLLMLDVSGAYDNVSHERLLHNLKKRRLGHLVPWVRAFLTGRSTRIRMPEGISDRISTPTGIPQGSPLSPILYLLYNADLIECAEEGMTASGWVDDVGFLVPDMKEKYNIRKLQNVCEAAGQWAKRHSSVFDVKKYSLIHFRHPELGEPRCTPLPLQTGTRTINIPATTTESARYLGFWLDPELTFVDHRQRAVQKASKSLEALRSLAGSTWGGSVMAMRRVYQAVVIPQMLYGVAAWHQPLGLTRELINEQIRPFAAIQKRAACMIGGAFRTTAAAALEIELHLPPIDIEMARIAKETALRLRTGPQFAIPPLMLQQRTPQQRWYGWSPAEEQAWRKGGCLMAPPDAVAGREWESRQAFVREPWRVPLKVTIEDREQATETHEQIYWESPTPLIIYTDGSGFEGKVGAAAQVDSAQEPNCFILSQMGSEDNATVYAAELRGTEMAMELVDNKVNAHELNSRRAVVFSDSQAALKGLLKPKMPSGQVFLLGTLRKLQQLTDQGVDIEFRWIPAHSDIFGNETVDQLAKEAATATSRGSIEEGHDTQNNRTLWLASAVRRRIRAEAKAEWHERWGKTRGARRTKKLHEKPNKQVLGYWSGQKKANASIMIQMRTGKIGLAAYLAIIKARDTPRCVCGLGRETVEHVLMECDRWEEERSDLRFDLFRKNVSMALGCQELLTHRDAAEPVAKFMVRTGLLGQFREVDPQAMGMEASDSNGDAEEGGDVEEGGDWDGVSKGLEGMAGPAGGPVEANQLHNEDRATARSASASRDDLPGPSSPPLSSTGSPNGVSGAEIEWW